MMLALSIWATRPVGVGWILGMGALIGLYFHIGFAQNPAFACGFLLAGGIYLIAVGRVPAGRIWALIGAILVGGGLFAPILHQQQRLMKMVSRPARR